MWWRGQATLVLTKESCIALSSPPPSILELWYSVHPTPPLSRWPYHPASSKGLEWWDLLVEKKPFSSYNWTLNSFPAWELGDSQIRFSLSNQGGSIKIFKVTWYKKQFYIIFPSKKAFQSYNLTFTFFPAWKLVVVPVGVGNGTHKSTFLSPIREAQ